MRIQKSNIDEIPSLYLVPTPIGNFDDMTYRSVEVLKNVDVIYCEDTRVTKILLSHFDIKTPLKSYHIFNEDSRCEEILNNLQNGLNIALVSDAGLPCISDPGFLISKYVIENNYNVISLPGASASLTALIASGLPNDKFYFNGFLNSKQSQRIKQLNNIKDIKETLIIYEAPHRIIETLQDIYKVFGNRNIVIARELTKKYEEYIRGSLEDIINNVKELKGEIVLIIEGAKETSEITSLNQLSILEHFQYYKNNNLSDNDAMKQVAKDRNVSKNVIYKEIKIKK